MERWPEEKKPSNPEEQDILAYEDIVTSAVRHFTEKTAKQQDADMLIEKIKEEADQGRYSIFGIKAGDDYDTICHKIINTHLESQNIGANISDTRPGESFSSEGRLLLENEYVKIQINDPENYIEKDERIKELIGVIEEEAKSFITPYDSLFKCVIVVNSNSLSIRMDPGRHKEFLGALLSDDAEVPDVIVYKHTPSNYESENSELAHRAEYIQKITAGEVDPKTGIVSKTLFIDQEKEFRKKFKEYFRLCQSVKDLDMRLRQGDVSFAANMFEGGVTNMVNFLSACDTFSSFEKYAEPNNSRKILNESEEKMLENYLSAYRERREVMKNTLGFIQEAKDLNFEIADDLLKLDDAAQVILSTSEQSPRTAQRFMEFYDQLAEKLINLEDLAKQSIGIRSQSLMRTDMARLVRQLQPKAAQMAQIARFGYGSPDALRTLEDGKTIVDAGEAGRKRLPEVALKAYEKFTELFGDKGDKLREWSDVETLEEALRFLHGVIVNVPVLFYPMDKRFFRGSDMEIGSLKIADITSNRLENSELAQTVIKEVKSLGRCFEDMIDKKDHFQYCPVAILADDYFQLSLPTGKHYIEMSGQLYDKEHQEFTIALRYVESGYPGAIERQDFAASIMEGLGFKLSRVRQDRGSLKANFRTQDKQEWNMVLSDIIRLSAALKDLDLHAIKDDMAGLFKEGVVARFEDFREIKFALGIFRGAEVSDHYKVVVQRIMNMGTDSERRLLVNLLVDNMRTFSKDLQPFLERLDKDELDDFAGYLFILEEEAQKGQDKKLAGRLHRIGDKIEELIFTK